MVTQDYGQPLSVCCRSLFLFHHLPISLCFSSMGQRRTEILLLSLSFLPDNPPNPGYREALLIKPWTECLFVFYPFHFLVALRIYTKQLIRLYRFFLLLGLVKGKAEFLFPCPSWAPSPLLAPWTVNKLHTLKCHIHISVYTNVEEHTSLKCGDAQGDPQVISFIIQLKAESTACSRGVCVFTHIIANNRLIVFSADIVTFTDSILQQCNNACISN